MASNSMGRPLLPTSEETEATDAHNSVDEIETLWNKYLNCSITPAEVDRMLARMLTESELPID